MQALVEEGKIKYIGLSEVDPDDLRKAHKVHPITAVQLEWSLWTRDAEVSMEIEGALYFVLECGNDRLSYTVCLSELFVTLSKLHAVQMHLQVCNCA